MEKLSTGEETLLRVVIVATGTQARGWPVPAFPKDANGDHDCSGAPLARLKGQLADRGRQHPQAGR